MKPLTLILLSLTLLWPAQAADLVTDGKAQAQIVISPQPARSVRVAAKDLQDYIAKISGAKLPIVFAPTVELPVKIYLGESDHTKKLGLTAKDLKFGAYRLISGPDWIAMIGDDTDFVPIEPWARNNAEIVSGKVQSEWDRITGEHWGVPNILMYKLRLRFPAETGLPDGQSAPLELWEFDERGSFNAVSGYLESLGVRWYLPGELGEVVPKMTTIPLPKIDQTVKPDFAMRKFNSRLGIVGHDTSLWSMHLGMRDPYALQIAHGMTTMTDRNEVFAEHPEWFALYGGKRHNQPEEGNNQLCYSNPDLIEATVRNARAQFDHFKLDSVSVMPPDGYTAMCQCPLCAGKDTPDRDERGRLSDYVWEFVNKVAKEVGKTHPGKKILNCAYGVYTLPPLKIEKLEPNVQVCIVGGRRPLSDKPEEPAELAKLRADWDAKTDNPLLIFENYPFIDRGWYLPAYMPKVLGSSINATKGVSDGEDISLSMFHDFHTNGIGFNHFMVYFTAKMFWGGQGQNVQALFEEYCRLFYGPAEKEMKAFFTYCEAHWRQMEKQKDLADQALALFAAAQAKAEPASVYGQRMALIDDYLKGLRMKSAQLGQKRGPVPVLRLVGVSETEIKIDGKLDDPYWEKCPAAATGSLWELQTGRYPTLGTSFKAGWRGNNLYFAIRCDEIPGDKPNIGATKDDDQAIWYGDAIEILLETESRSYYQIAVSPSGAVVDLDRSADRAAWFSWDSQAEVATHVAEDHWTVEIRIPVTQDENDPLHQVIGRHRIVSLPWHLNLCRQRVRGKDAEYSAFSPTGTDGFHEPMKMAHFYNGNSFTFKVDPSVTDFLLGFRAARDLSRQIPPAERLEAYVALSGLDKATPFQKSAALEQAAVLARHRNDLAKAEELVAAIPLEPVRQTARMQLQVSTGKSAEAVAEMGSVDLASWPFWQIGAGSYLRGQAYAAVGKGAEAEADFTRAMAWTPDPRARLELQLAQARNLEVNLKDPPRALEAYQAMVAVTGQNGGATYFTAVQAAARLLRESGKNAEALAVLENIKFAGLKGHWLGSMLLARGDVYQAAGRTAEARADYEALLADASTEAGHRKTAEERIKGL